MTLFHSLATCSKKDINQTQKKSYLCKRNQRIVIMAKIGYLWLAPHYETIEEDKKWMIDFGCVNVVEEQTAHEKLRPEWQHLMNELGRGDILVISKFSNVLRGVRELSLFLEICRIKVIRIISIHDKIDSASELFPETKTIEVLNMIGSLTGEILSLRRATERMNKLKRKRIAHSPSALAKMERNKMVINMYKSGHSIQEIHDASGFCSRSSIFRILNSAGIDLNRGHTKGPIKRKNI